MAIVELTGPTHAPVASSALCKALEDLGLPIGSNTVRVEVDYEHDRIVLHKVAEDEGGRVLSVHDGGRVLSVHDGGRTYWATYAVEIPINHAA